MNHLQSEGRRLKAAIKNCGIISISVKRLLIDLTD